MTNEQRQEAHPDGREAAERHASSSEESPTNVTRSTQDLTVGGSEKDPEAQSGVSDAEQAVENQKRALEIGEESPG